MNTVFIVTRAIVTQDRVICALVHDNYKSIMIITPQVIEGETPPRAVLSWVEPDGLERLEWLERMGVITEAEFVRDARKLQGAQKLALYESLKREMER